MPKRAVRPTTSARVPAAPGRGRAALASSGNPEANGVGARRRPLLSTGLVFITRQVHFNAAHRLHNPAKSRRWNQEQYGFCANPHWHGHNYVLEVTVSGHPDPETGYVLDLAKLKQVVHAAVVDKCDHRNLNTDVPFLRGVIPSTENLVVAFWQQIEPRLPAGRLHRVRLYETPRNFAEYYGPDIA